MTGISFLMHNNCSPFTFSHILWATSIVIVQKFDFGILVEISVLGFPETKKWFLQNVCPYVCLSVRLSVCLSVNKVLDRRSNPIFMKIGIIVPYSYTSGRFFFIFLNF